MVALLVTSEIEFLNIYIQGTYFFIKLKTKLTIESIILEVDFFMIQTESHYNHISSI